MDTPLFDRIRAGLSQKRENLARWAQTASPEKKQLRLGPATASSLSGHLSLIETAIGRACDRTLGCCSVCGDTVDAALLEADFTASVCLGHLSTQERQRLEADLELSQVVQRALFPQVAPAIPGLEIAFFSRPAQILGGDFLGFFRYKDGSHGMAIADVAGHGISTSALMASVQTALHTLVPANDSPAEVLSQVNRFFCHNVSFTTFVTLFLARLESGSRQLLYANAGHNPALLYRQDGTAGEQVRWLGPTGAAIGLVEEFSIATEELPLEVGDLLLLYTDGVTEATDPSGREYGARRLEGFMRRTRGGSSQEILAGLRHDLREFIGDQPLADDTTVLVCRVTQAETPRHPVNQHLLPEA